MTGAAGHYAAAERLLAAVDDGQARSEGERALMLVAAELHARLAAVAVAAQDARVRGALTVADVDGFARVGVL